MNFLTKVLNWFKGKRTLIYGILSFVTGLIAYTVDSDLWGLFPNQLDKVTAVLLMVNGWIVTVLRWLTSTPILKK